MNVDKPIPKEPILDEFLPIFQIVVFYSSLLFFPVIWSFVYAYGTKFEMVGLLGCGKVGHHFATRRSTEPMGKSSPTQKRKTYNFRYGSSRTLGSTTGL